METRHILEHLEKIMTLEAVSRGGSIRKASQILNISQPSLSVKIRGLEDILGLKLLDRTRDGVELTQGGLTVLNFVHSIQNQAEELKLQLERDLNIVKGHVRIGLYDSIARYFWPSFYKYFSKKYPDISITVTTGRSNGISAGIADRNLDLGIVVGKPPTKDTITTPLYRDTFSCFCTRKFARDVLKVTPSGTSITLDTDQYTNLPLIFFSHAKVQDGDSLHALLQGDVLDNFQIHPVENFELARAFCLEHIGLAILPNQVARGEFKKGLFIKVGLFDNRVLNFNHHSIDLVVKKSLHSQPIMEIVAKEIRSFVKTPAPQHN